ncbi:MAG: CoA pyrophosphatase [Ottowia sp.]|nr:CoA pyrophosphatase [Ottowia sp.]
MSRRLTTLNAQSCPIEQVTHLLPALTQAQMHPTVIQKHLAHTHTASLYLGDIDHQISTHTSAYTKAAVLIPLIARQNSMTVLLTQRAHHLYDHPGQISFPGGKHTNQDSNATDTALRETHEEIGLAAKQITVLGIMPKYITITGYCITPVIGLITPPFTLTPDPSEVTEVFEVPFDFLMNPAHHQHRYIQTDQEKRYFYAITYPQTEVNNYFIWGATAGLIRNLYLLLAS